MRLFLAALIVTLGTSTADAPDGKVVNWAIEAGSPNSLLRRGLRQADFPIGSEVIIDGYRVRNGTPTANGTTVKFANGRNFFLGAPSDTAPTKR